MLLAMKPPYVKPHDSRGLDSDHKLTGSDCTLAAPQQHELTEDGLERGVHQRWVGTGFTRLVMSELIELSQ